MSAHRTTAYTKHGNCKSRVEALSLGPSATQQGGVGNVSVRGARCVVANDVVHVSQDPLFAPRCIPVRVSETETRQQKPRKCFASVNRDPVDKEAIQEGNLLGNALPDTVQADLMIDQVTQISICSRRVLSG